MTQRSGSEAFSFHSAVILLSFALIVAGAANAGASSATHARSDDGVRLPGHVLPTIAAAVRLEQGGAQLKARAAEPITLTVVLKREHQAEFDSYRRDLYDSRSPRFHRFLTQHQIADRFGPTRAAYDQVSAYFRAKGFTIVAGSVNRLTLTIKGTRRGAEQALDLHFSDYKWRKREFFANDRDPMLP